MESTVYGAQESSVLQQMVRYKQSFYTTSVYRVSRVDGPIYSWAIRLLT